MVHKDSSQACNRLASAFVGRSGLVYLHSTATLICQGISLGTVNHGRDCVEAYSSLRKQIGSIWLQSMAGLHCGGHSATSAYFS